jgi:hypothetical protein
MGTAINKAVKSTKTHEKEENCSEEEPLQWVKVGKEGT